MLLAVGVRHFVFDVLCDDGCEFGLCCLVVLCFGLFVGGGE